MLPLWLREFRRRLSARPQPFRRLRVEQLEDRTTPATITWTNPASGNWGTAANWDLNRAPAAGDDVVIPDLGTTGPSLTVTLIDDTWTVRSVTSAENVTLARATLTLSGGTKTVSVSGKLLLGGGGVLKGATISSGVNEANGGGLDAATIAAGTTVRVTGSAHQGLFVRNGLTIDGTLAIGDAAGTTAGGVYAEGSQTLGGTGDILFNSRAANVIRQANAGATTLTFGPGLLIHGGEGGIDGNDTVGSASALVFNGPVRPDTGGGSILIGRQAASVTTAGAVEAINGRYVEILTSAGGTWTNTGTVTAGAGAGSRVTIAGSFISNVGTIELDGGILRLAGSLTQAGLGPIERTGGTIDLAGILTGGLTLSDTTGSWNLAAGRLVGGTYAVVPGSTAALLPTTSGGTFDGVTINAPLDLGRVNNAAIGLRGNIVLNSTVFVGAADGGTSGRIDVDAGTTITTTAPAGTAQFVSAGTGRTSCSPARRTPPPPSARG